MNSLETIPGKIIMPTMTYIHRHNRGFTDAEILDNNFPNPQMNVKEHRLARHQYYRQQVQQIKNRTAIQLYSKGWVGILWDLFHQ